MRKLIINHFWLALAGLAVIGTTGWYFARSNVDKVHASEINEYIEMAETASTIATAEELKTLTGSEADLENPAYLSIKDHLIELDKASNYSNYFYILGMSGSQVIYLLDSTSMESSLHNQFGQVYHEVGSDAARQIFADGKSTSTNHYNNGLDERISVLVPIKDLESGRVLAVFGFDVSQEQWLARISVPQREPTLVTFFTSLIYLGFIAYSAWSQKAQIELKQEIEARVESDDARQRQFAENPGVMLLIDPASGTVVDANQAALNFYQYPPETLLNMTFFELNTPPRERIQQEMSSVEKNVGTIFSGSHILADGSLRDVEIKLSLIHIDGRKVIHVNINDITERKRTEESLRESQSSLQAVMQSTADGLLAVNNENKVIFSNERFAELWRIPPAVIASKDDTVLVGHILDQLINPKEFVEKIQKLYGSLDESFDTLIFKDGRVFERLSHPLMREGKKTGRVWSFRDVTARKLAEELLRQSEDNYRTVADFTYDWESWRAPDGSYRYVSPACERITGHKANEFLADSNLLMQIAHPDDRPILAEHLHTVFVEASQDDLEIDFRIFTPTGETRWVSHSCISVHGEDGQWLGRRESNRDITERKQMEQELRSQRDFATQIVNVMGQGLTVTDEDGRFEFVNPAYARMFGYEPSDLIGKYPTDITVPEDQLLLTEQKMRRQAGLSSTYESRLVRADGSLAHALITSVPRKNGINGVSGGSIAVITDLTELKKAEGEVRESETRFRSLFDDSPISLWEEDFSEVKQRLDDLRAGGVTDFDAYLGEHPEVVAECISLVRVLDVNKATLNLYGALTKEDLITNLSASLPETANEYFRNELVQIASGALRFEMEMVAQALDGRMLTVNLNWAAISGYESSLSKVIVSIIDITEKKQAEDELLDINRQLEELIIRANTFAAEAEMANIAKSEFLANMSHEIRTPMNGVIGMTGLLLDTDLTTEQRDYAGIIRSSGESLLSVINDILDFSKVEARKLELELLDFDLKEVLKDTVGIFSLQVQEKGLRLSLTIEPDVACLLRGDPGRLRQIIVNLIGNAVKFTPQGTVSVQVKKEAETEKETTLRFSIKDSGIGIPPNRISSLFTPFTQVDSSATRRYGGTGLGLAISKQLAELMNGSVGVESMVGQGSTFWFTAVFGRQTSPTLPNSKDGLKLVLPKFGIDEVTLPPENEYRNLTQPDLPAKNMHLLLVEDNQTNQKVALSILKKLGYSADAVANGIEALEILQKIPYDLVLMDCQMPEMDGFTATAKIRASDSAVLNPRVPVIAMTAHAMKGDRERCLAAGMDDYLTKPIAPAALAEKIAHWLHGLPEASRVEISPDHQVFTEKSSPPETQVINEDESKTERVEIFNEADLLKRLMGDRELAKTIVGAFLEEIPHQIAELKREAAHGSSANARIQAHTIRGASANLAAEALRQIAHEVEIMAVRGDLDGLTNMIPMIEAQFDLFEETIKKTTLLANSPEGVNL
ncbi:MAG: PAS domain S-box protein [Chloroflexi bacterium]|nr:PAS domain S-box protein [Chloroflexota bacterium]